MVDIAKFAELGDDAHISLRSFRRSGEAVDTPVWYTTLDGRLYLRTTADSAKVKRIRREPRVQYAPCRWDGELHGEWRTGRARVLEDGDSRAVKADIQMQEKYGTHRREMTELMAQLNKPLCYIEILPDEANEQLVQVRADHKARQKT